MRAKKKKKFARKLQQHQSGNVSLLLHGHNFELKIKRRKVGLHGMETVISLHQSSDRERDLKQLSLTVVLLTPHEG